MSEVFGDGVVVVVDGGGVDKEFWKRGRKGEKGGWRRCWVWCSPKSRYEWVLSRRRSGCGPVVVLVVVRFCCGRGVGGRG